MISRVLIADDETTLRMALHELIDWTKLNCEVVYEARDGIEALDYLRGNTVDIAILDIRMPGLDGLQVCKILRQDAIDTAVILLTAYSDFSLVRDALRLGVCDYVLKSNFENELPSAVSKALAQRNEPKEKAAFEIAALQPNRRYADPVNQAISYLREHYAEKIKVTDVADRLYLNASYICRLYKKETGNTIMEDLTRYRIERAKLLLQEGATVNETASGTGFENAAYFSGVFSRMEGISPGRYRKDALEQKKSEDER